MRQIFKLCALICVPAFVLASCKPEEEDNNATPEITVKSTFEVSGEGGEQVIDYVLTNPADGGVMSAAVDAECDWITDIDCTEGGKIKFNVAASDKQENRSTLMTMEYTYGKTPVVAAVNIIQGPSAYKYIHENCQMGIISYYGTTIDPNNEVYFVSVITEVDGENFAPNAGRYSLLMLSKTPSERGDIVLPDGTYTVGEEIVVNDNSSIDYVNDAANGWAMQTTIKSGTVVVKNEGGKTNITIDVVDAKGDAHYAKYSGVATTNDYRFVSTLEEDVDLKLDGKTLGAYYAGIFDEYNLAYWQVEILDDSRRGLMLDIYADKSFDFAAGFPTGTFTVPTSDQQPGPGMLPPGFIDNNRLYGSWFVTVNSEGYIIDPMAPIAEGKLVVTKNGDNYTLNLDTKDDAGNLIKASWTGVPKLQDISNSAPAMVMAPKSGLNEFSIYTRLVR